MSIIESESAQDHTEIRPISEGIVQMLLELWQERCHDPCPAEPVSVPKLPLNISHNIKFILATLQNRPDRQLSTPKHQKHTHLSTYDALFY